MPNENAKQFVREVKELAKKYGVNFFVVTDGFSAISNEGNEAVHNARKAHEAWEKAHGYNPDESWA